MKRKSYAGALLAVILAAVPFGLVSANGLIFFSAQAEVVIAGTPYFGAVLDERGRPVPGAFVTIYLESENLEFVVRTGVDGRYRNASIRRDVDPNLVHVSVSMPGYEIVRAVPRTAVLRPGLPREINFVLAPV